MNSQNLKIRTIFAVLGVALAVVWAMPNVVDFKDKWWFSKNKMNFGLDIQGGLHLVMGVDVEGVIGESVGRLVTNLRSELAKEQIQVTEVKSDNPLLGEVTVVVASPEAVTRLQKYMGDQYATMLQEFSSAGTAVTYRYFEAYLIDYRNRVIQQSIETIRNRIDEFGVAEPSISQQGTDRILIQLPGLDDAEKAKQLINTTAKLNFMLLETTFPQDQLLTLISEAEKAGNYKLADMKYSDYIQKLNDDLIGKIPEKTVVYLEKAENAVNMEAGALPYLLKLDVDLGGDDLDDAFVTFDPQNGSPVVSIRFNAAGTTKFAALTTANVNKRMAIVLDKVVKSAPVINEPITGGSGQISLGTGRNREAVLDEAQMIATSLRAGALPAALEQLEERRVGPSLGADSVAKAETGALVGAMLIVLFMLGYYKGMGAISVFGLTINIVSVFGILSNLGATLTLPGIAGIALTVGFAVDANVLINERIREELRRGASLKSAIRDGYDKALSAILDSNITTAATAIVLLYFGTGPVRGFAVTLLVGIMTTMFANVFVSKVLVDNLVFKFGLKKISV